ncbi:MAG: macro domain-containing protein [Anaerolineales bacterium]|nr:macro domain-containing protein [Anaerolineales bacterium]
MLEYRTGNLLQADVEALVNTVNTVGVMGKGIALQFKQAFPENFRAFEKAAKHQDIQPGRVFVFKTGRYSNPKFIINFPTKRHWRGKARIEDIESGLVDLVRVIRENEIRSIAIPPLGCGFGGLDWNEVRALIEQAMNKLPDVAVWVYSPLGAPEPDQMPVATKRPNLTLERAALIELIGLYAQPGYRLTQLEVQKLAYFLQASGQSLRLDYVKHQYGPYAEKLNFVLQHLEGHYLRGYGARSGNTSLHLIPGAEQEAGELLASQPDTKERLDRISRLIQGFETPYAMELLATVHWLAQENEMVKKDAEAAVRGFSAWSDRKREYFQPEHIHIAWNQLHQQGWI